MEQLTKILSLFTNLANYAVGIIVAIILVFKQDFISVFFIMGMTTNESLFFNLTAFQIGLALISILLCIMVKDRKKPGTVIEFPLFFMFVPAVVSVIGVIFGIKGETPREMLVVIASSLLYLLLSGIIIYCGTKVFQIFPNKNEK